MPMIMCKNELGAYELIGYKLPNGHIVCAKCVIKKEHDIAGKEEDMTLESTKLYCGRCKEPLVKEPEYLPVRKLKIVK
jgi:hypothetical protein